MKSNRLVFLISAACLFNLLFFLPNSWNAIRAYADLHRLTNPERRVLQWGNWYRAVMQIQEQIPPSASVRLIYTSPPWYLAYYLYPRILKQGSDSIADRDGVRKKYPQDWVLVYSESPQANLTAYPPHG